MIICLHTFSIFISLLLRSLKLEANSGYSDYMGMKGY